MFTSLQNKCSRDRKNVVKKYLASAEQQKQQENFIFHLLENVPRPMLPWLQSGAHCACVCVYMSLSLCLCNVNICYAYAYVTV